MNTYFKRVVVGSFCVMQLFASMQAIVVNFEGKEPEYFANIKTWGEVATEICESSELGRQSLCFSIAFNERVLLTICKDSFGWWSKPISKCLESPLLKMFYSSDLTINAFIPAQSNDVIQWAQTFFEDRPLTSTHQVQMPVVVEAVKVVVPTSDQRVQFPVELAQKPAGSAVVTADVTAEDMREQAELNKYIMAFKSLLTRYKEDITQFIEDMMFSDVIDSAIDKNFNVLDSMNSKLYQKFYDSLSVEQRDDFKQMFFYGTRRSCDGDYLYENLQNLTRFFSIRR